MDPNVEVFNELQSRLAGSDTQLRKRWAQRILRQQVPVIKLMSLLRGNDKTAQRFVWLMGDLLNADATVLQDCLPMLFDLRNQMSFPGIQRTAGKCFWHLGVLVEMEYKVVPQLFEWLADNQFEVSIKHYAAKILYRLAEEERIDPVKLGRILKEQSEHPVTAHAKRMSKLRMKLSNQIY